MGSRLSISKAYTTPLRMQSNGLILTPVSAVGPSAQARDTAQQEKGEKLADFEESSNLGIISTFFTLKSYVIKSVVRPSNQNKGTKVCLNIGTRATRIYH